MDRGTGWLLIVAGVALVLLGVLLTTGGLSWFGRLPGDLRFERGGTRVFVPVTSMVLASVALTVVVNVVLRLFR